MLIQSTERSPSLPIRTLSKGESPDQAVDLSRLYATPREPSSERTLVGIVQTVQQPGTRDYGKLVKGAEAAYNFAVNDALLKVPAGLDATVRGGLVLWDGIELAGKIQAGEADAVDIGLSIAKAGANTAAILDALDVVPINPLWTKSVIMGCTVMLALKEFYASGKTVERTLVYGFEPEDIQKLPAGDVQQAAYCSMGLAAAAIAGGKLVAETPESDGSAVPPPPLAFDINGPVTQMLRSSVVAGPPIDREGSA